MQIESKCRATHPIALCEILYYTTRGWLSYLTESLHVSCEGSSRLREKNWRKKKKTTPLPSHLPFHEKQALKHGEIHLFQMKYHHFKGFFKFSCNCFCQTIIYGHIWQWLRQCNVTMLVYFQKGVVLTELAASFSMMHFSLKMYYLKKMLAIIVNEYYICINSTNEYPNGTNSWVTS